MIYLDYNATSPLDPRVAEAMAALQAYTIDLLSEVEKESGQNINLHMTGGITVASAPARCAAAIASRAASSVRSRIS
mgnify:CR=1 FL=1